MEFLVEFDINVPSPRSRRIRTIRRRSLDE
jgi:hypothetical protein